MTAERPQQIRTIADVHATRRAYLEAVFGAGGWPVSNVATVTKSFQPANIADVESLRQAGIPAGGILAGLWNAAEELTVTVNLADHVHTAVAYHLRAGMKRLAIVHHGHGDDFAAGGYRLLETAHDLLRRGSSVLFMYMPNYGPATRTPGDLDPAGDRHGPIFTEVDPTVSNTAFRPFLEPVIACLNHLTTAFAYDQIHMIGLSGGGWTTDLCAALDSRIRCSISVSGSLPLDLRFGSSVGDEEQMHPALFDGVIGYRDLYTLGGFGLGRSHFQFLNENDSCCFSDAQSRPGEMTLLPDLRRYAADVASRLVNLRAGRFELRRFNDNSNQHRISPQATSDASQLFVQDQAPESPLYFHATAGPVAHGLVHGSGRYSYLGRNPEPQPGFTHVLATRDGSVLLYDSPSGRAIRTGIRPSPFTPLSISVRGVGAGWTHLAAGGSGACLLYNATLGTVRVGMVDSTGDFVDIGAPVAPLPVGCTHIAGSPQGALLLLDAATGRAILGSLDHTGFARTNQLSGLRPGCTSVVSVNDSALFFYNAATGTGTTALFDATGEFVDVGATALRVPEAANHVVGGSNGALVFINNADASGTVWQVDEFAEVRPVEVLSGFAEWTHVVAG